LARETTRAGLDQQQLSPRRRGTQSPKAVGLHCRTLAQATVISAGRVAPGGHSRPACDDYPVTLTDLSRLASQLDGVSESRREGLLGWRYRGRLVARQLDDSHIVIRASFEFRDLLLQSFPETFSVPKRFAKHMMVVADLENGNPDAVEDAVIGAWELQSGK
jgi:hypothetical protein